MPKFQNHETRNSSALQTEREPGKNVASTKAEAGLYSEADVIKKQAKHAQALEDQENLLRARSGGRQSDGE